MKKRWISSAHYGVTASSRRHFLLRADSSLHRSPCPPPPSRPPCSPSLSSSSPLCPLRSLRAGDLDLAKKKVKRLPALPRPAQKISKTFPKIDSWHKQTIGKTGWRNEEPTLATSGRSRRLTASSRDAAIARALTPPLDGGGRRGPRGRFSLALFLLLENKASKVVSCGLPTRVWGQLTGQF